MKANNLFNSLLLLLLIVLTVAPGPGQCSETYYVIPADEPPNCPGYPCLSLDEYMKNIDIYFSSDKVNVTMRFVPGVHLSDHKDTVISDLNMFEMEGIERPEGVIVCFSVLFTNVSRVLIKSLTFSLIWGCTLPRISFANVSTVVIKSVTGGQTNPTTVSLSINTTGSDADCMIFPLKETIAVSGEACPGLTAAYNNITVAGDTTFANRHETALTAYDSLVTLSGYVSFVNNSGTNGGAMALYSSTLNIARNTTMYFYNNKAREVGGAIYVSATYNPYKIDCFYQLLNYTNSSKEYSLRFEANTAEKGGNHIYGVNMQDSCVVAYYRRSSYGWVGETIKSYQATNYFFMFVPESLSSISSDPMRICLCDPNGHPRCADSISDIYRDYSVSPGETFTLSVVIVGGSFGTTTGTVYANFLPPEDAYLHAPSLKDNYQHAQWITNHKKCFELQYTVYSRNSQETLYLTSASLSQSTVKDKLNRRYKIAADIDDYHSRGVISNDLLISPIFLNIILLPCPPGFSLKGDLPSCECYIFMHMCPELIDKYDINCSVIGIISWNGPLWIGIQGEFKTAVVNNGCPTDYCEPGPKTVDFQKNDLDSQCAFNRAGRLCGGCKENYSLAIGSSQCIYCPNNNNLSLVIFFAAAGFLLVFFISVLNLTVTQGWINGLIFYANIVWAYQGLLFPEQTKTNVIILFGRIFIAWLNLDFGIQTCFFNGLDAFWKTWLQFVFPFYTAGLFIIGLRYSSNLSKLFGGRSVPTLVTLLFLSHSKLLRTIITSLELAHLTNYPSNTTWYVWSIDGRLDYGHFPHIMLLLAALACLLLLWLPYTLLLLLMQWLRRIAHSRTSKWITKYKPVCDAYFAPLKDNHHYWFGVLLLARGILLLISSLTANINPEVCLFLLLAVATLLLCYMNYMQVYKRNSVLILESAFLINLVLLVGGTMYYHGDRGSHQKAILVYVSIGIAFVKFCGIVILSLVQFIHRCIGKCTSRPQSSSTSYTSIGSEDKTVTQQDALIQDSCQFRDSILEDASLFYKKHPTY